MGDYFTLRIDTFRIPPESELRERLSLRPTAERYPEDAVPDCYCFVPPALAAIKACPRSGANFA